MLCRLAGGFQRCCIGGFFYVRVAYIVLYVNIFVTDDKKRWEVHVLPPSISVLRRTTTKDLIAL